MFGAARRAVAGEAADAYLGTINTKVEQGAMHVMCIKVLERSLVCRSASVAFLIGRFSCLVIVCTRSETGQAPPYRK